MDYGEEDKSCEPLHGGKSEVGVEHLNFEAQGSAERGRSCRKGDHSRCDGTEGVRGYCLCACHPEDSKTLIARLEQKKLNFY